MMSTRTILIIFCVSTFLACTKEAPAPTNTIDDYTLIYQELLGVEYALLTQDHTEAVLHINSLDDLLKESYNLFCPEESAQLDGARLNNQILKQNILGKKTSSLFDDLRILKASIINLQTDDDYDPYFAFLWRFEEEMDYTTTIAMDPLLDLYEWNEFEDMVACMNQTWQPVRNHSPSPAALNYDPLLYKNQTVYKIYLENAVANFIKAVESNDYENFPLCENAEALRTAYIEYIKTFINSSEITDSFLAQL
ncbi:MAG: hypothetical protein P1U56_23285 [Saprospiraceae bacterium]|nr:hypothetical protein [Saprospiraceae bacterium]